jgi:hypothetical protein
MRHRQKGEGSRQEKAAIDPAPHAGCTHSAFLYLHFYWQLILPDCNIHDGHLLKICSRKRQKRCQPRFSRVRPTRRVATG